jgi:hypothetical protein
VKAPAGPVILCRASFFLALITVVIVRAPRAPYRLTVFGKIGWSAILLNVHKLLRNTMLAAALSGFFGIRAAPIRSVPHQSPIRVVEKWVVNNFPEALTFGLEVEADEPLVRAELIYRQKGDTSSTRQPVTFESGRRVQLTYTWDTANITVAPSSPVVYYWEVEGAVGSRLKTPEATYYYNDVRFAWDELRQGDLIVRWYEGGQVLGQKVFEVAQLALARMQESSGQRLDFPIHILLYANAEDFASWHSYVDTWVGGEAFPALGVTAQILPPDTDDDWIMSVIPHEIAHLFFYQAVHTPYASWPSWLDEGLAQYYEFVDQQGKLKLAAQAARQGRLLPLRALSGSFGRDAEQVQLAYAESVSVVMYLLETWGDPGLQALVQDFREGVNPQKAVQQALGVSWEVFEADWITWMGVPATPRPPATPTTALVWPTARSGWPTVTPRPVDNGDSASAPSTSQTALDCGICPLIFGAAGLGMVSGVAFYLLRRRQGGA